MVDVPISEVHPTGKGAASIMGLFEGRHSAAPRHGPAGPPCPAARNSRLYPHRQPEDR